jgi:Cu-Zn family superoxide dismutase
MRHIARTAAVVVAVTSCVGLVATPALGAPAPLRVSGVATSDGAGGAFTYDPVQLPSGSRLVVGVTYPSSGSMVVTLHVKGAVPNRDYGAHAHVAACGALGSAAGSHFQLVPDPVSPSTDPAYANPSNEVWLDLETDAYGNGSAQTVVPWQPGDRRPMSVVVHAMHTSTAPGTAGTAGTRLGCLTVPF